jgi:TatD DNase family protein
MGLIDVHAHYDTYISREKLQQLTEGYSKIILNGMDYASNKRCLEYASPIIKVAMGFHPLHITNKQELEDAQATIDYIKKHSAKIVAIGEIGLDFFHIKDVEAQEYQKKGFREYLKLAESLQLPVILHTRNAVADIFYILKDFTQPVILHCLEASEKNIREAMRRKYYFSIPPAVVRNEQFQKIVRIAPISQLLTETDAPFQGPTKGVSATPSDIQIAIEKIAEIKGLDKLEVEHMMQQNYQRVFSE